MFKVKINLCWVKFPSSDALWELFQTGMFMHMRIADVKAANNYNSSSFQILLFCLNP